MRQLSFRWRILAASLIALAALVLLHRLVVVPWECNEVEGRVSRATEMALQRPGSYESRRIAARNASLILECAEKRKTDVNLSMLAGSNLQLLGRHESAVSMFKRALAHDRRPELYVALALAQIDLGMRDAALENFVQAAQFAGPQILDDVPDGEIRHQASIRVGRFNEMLLASRGQIDDRNRIRDGSFALRSSAVDRVRTSRIGTGQSAAAEWLTFNSKASPLATSIEPSGRLRSGNALHVVTTSPDSGVFQRWDRSNVTARVRTSAWVYVSRGRVYIGSGTGRSLMSNARSTITGRWEHLEGTNESCPALMTVIYSDGPEGADFLVTDVEARPTMNAPPCDR